MNSKEINKFVLAVLFCFFTMNTALPQVAINTNGAQPDSKSILDVASTTLGVLLPRMTEAQRTAITSPPQGLLVFQIDGGVNAGLYYATGEGNNWTLIFHSNTTAITGTGSQNYIPYWTGTNALAFTGMYWDNTNGRLGIGTTSPLAKLQVDGNVYINHAAAPGFYGQSAGVSKVYLGYDAAGTGLQLYNFTSRKSLMVQDNGALVYSGNVGIGTDAPTAQLDVLSSNTYGISSTGSTTGSTGLYHIANSNATTSWNLGVEGGTWAGGSSGSLYIDKDGVGPKMTIAPSGNVGIGTTNPIRGIHNGTPEMIVAENQSGLADWKKWRVYLGGGAGAKQSLVFGILNDAGTSGMWEPINMNPITQTTTITNNLAITGNVGIGTTTPSYKLHVAGGTIRNDLGSAGVSLCLTGGGSNLQVYHNSGSSVYLWNSAGGVYEFYNSGGSTSTGTLVAGAYTIGSDRRLKNNIVNTHFGINDLMKVQVRDYVYKSDSSKTLTTGFIAQELYDIFPNAVTKPAKEEDMWSVDYGKVTPLLVKAIQDQQSEITSLKSEMEQMKSDIQQLKSGNALSNAGFGGNISNIVIVLIIGIGVALFYYRKTHNNFNNKHLQ